MSLWCLGPSSRSCFRLPRPRVQLWGRFVVEMVRGPWCHRPLFRPWSRVGNFLFRLRVQLEVEGQMPIRYIESEVLCGDTSTNVPGVIQWGVCRYPWLWEDGERMLFGE